MIEDHGGELLVGEALVVKTNHADIPYMISAPTMRVPMILKDTVNVYLATKAIIRTAINHPDICNVAIPGMGTGVGRVSPEICARQMKAAFDAIANPIFPLTWRETQIQHQNLCGNIIRDLQEE